jgi:DNA mismatch repair ATPase MutS
MNSVFAEMNGAYPLVLVDEPYTGTNPGDAESLLKEMIQACSEEGISLMLTTHFHGLIDFITTLPNGRNLHCVVNSNKGFTYQIQPGSSRISNALLVAEHAGVRLDQLKKTIQERKNYVPQEATASDGDDLPF